MFRACLHAVFLCTAAIWSGAVWAESLVPEETGPVETRTVTVGSSSVPPEIALEGLPSGLAPEASLRPSVRRLWPMPNLRWDEHPRGDRWTSAVMGALRGHGAPLLDVVPRDIEAWCPAYPTATQGDRAAFWAGLISTLAWHESTHRPRAVGGGGRWFGLVQIAPSTARFRDCAVGSGEALLDGSANLQCGVRIMATTVPRDGVVAAGNRGVAADWGPMHSSQSRKREDIRNWVRSQEYCQRPVRPTPRPVGFLASVLRPLSGPGHISAQRPLLRPQAMLEAAQALP